MNKNFCLVLGWWAARWLAHIGVIRRLNELNISPCEISGTSIGALIWAFYAAWYTAEEMKKIAIETNFLKLIDLDLKHGLLKGNKIMKYLSRYLWEIEFQDLKIPLTIISTDINTGEKIIHKEGRVIDAIRASISIPGVFIPYKYQWRHLIDGWITENLPISVLENTDYPIVAVSVQFDPKKQIKIKKTLLFPNGSIFSNSYGIIRKMVGIMMSQNEARSIEWRKNLLLIRPEQEEIDYYDFKKMKQMIQEWYKISESIINFL